MAGMSLSVIDEREQDSNGNDLVNTFREYRDAGKLSEAAQIAANILRTSPESHIMWSEYGLVLANLGMPDHAISCFKHARSINPDGIYNLFLLGKAIIERCNWHHVYHKSGLTRPPWSTPGFCEKLDIRHFEVTGPLIGEIFNIGLDLADLGFFEESIACHQLVSRVMPDFIQVHYALSCSLLSMGRFSEAVPSMIEWANLSRKTLPFPYWGGEDLTGKKLYIFADQGLGDIVQFIRFVPAVARKCAKVSLYIPKPLWRFIGQIPNVEIVTRVTEHFDYMISMFLLPHAFGIDPAILPSFVPYLQAEPALVEHWRRRLPEDGFRIGIAWQGNPESPLDQGRSLPLACYAPIARLPGVRLVSLQMNFGLDQLESLPEGMSVTTLGPEFNAGPDNVVDTAAVMRSLDLIISSDTSVPHIAGALGCPVWVLLKAVPDWRWMQGREDSPWYPTMRLFRQRAAGEWDEVIERVVGELTRLLESRSA